MQVGKYQNLLFPCRRKKKLSLSPPRCPLGFFVKMHYFIFIALSILCNFTIISYFVHGLFIFDCYTKFKLRETLLSLQ